MKKFVLAAIVGASLIATAGASPNIFRAELESPVAERTRVVASSVVWLCEGNTCLAQKDTRTVSVRQCRALAEEVGRIVSFGGAERQLTAEQVAECNQRAGV
jgi:hypothetical protein